MQKHGFFQFGAEKTGALGAEFGRGVEPGHVFDFGHVGGVWLFEAGKKANEKV